MKISIIREDKMVVKEGIGIDGLTLSSCPSDTWAVQWDTTTSKGEVEKNDLSVETITSLGVYQACIDEFDTAKAALDAASASDEEAAKKKEADAAAGKAKLKELGLTDDQIAALMS